MADKTDKDLSAKREDFYADKDYFSIVQNFLDRNIRIVKNVSWIIGGVGIIVIIRRTYALHHFTSQSAIPEKYFQNSVTLTGKVLKIHSSGTLGVQHVPLLWRARLKRISEPGSTLLNINITGVELQDGGIAYLEALCQNANNVKFKLLGKDNCGNIESIIYQSKSWFRQVCINEDIVKSGFAKANHVPSLSRVKAYNQLIERLVKAEVKAVRSEAGIWNRDEQNGFFYKVWHWLKSKLFKS